MNTRSLMGMSGHLLIVRFNNLSKLIVKGAYTSIEIVSICDRNTISQQFQSNPVQFQTQF